MRVYIVFIILFTFLVKTCLSQQFRVDPYGNIDGATSVIIVDSIAYVFGGTKSSKNELLKLEFNLNSNQVASPNRFSSSLDNLNSTVAAGTVRLDSMTLLAGTSQAWLNAQSRPQFVVANYHIQQDSVSVNTYGDTAYWWAAAGFKVNRNSEIVVGGWTDSTGIYNFMLSVIKKNNQRKFTKTFGSSVREELGFSIDTCINGGYILGGYDLIGSTYKTKVIRVDSLGTEVWSKNNFSDMPCNSILTCKDGGYLISTGKIDSTSGTTNYSKGYIIKINEAGSIIWTRAFGAGGNQQYLSTTRELSNGSFISCGSKRSRVDGQNVWNGYLHICDSLGVSEFYKEYRYLNDSTSDHYLRDIQPTPDGGYLAVGYIYPRDGTSQDVWILRVDSTGCEQVNCAVPGIKKRSTHNAIKVYPNPFSSELSVELDDNLSKGCLIQIFNSAGELVYSQSQNVSAGRFTISDLNSPPGIYLLSISCDERVYRTRIIKSE